MARLGAFLGALAFLSVTQAALLVATPASVSTVLLGGNLSNMIVDRHRYRLYVADASEGTIIVWNTSSEAEVAQLRVGPAPTSLDISFNGSELFVALSGTKALAVVDLDKLELSRLIQLSATPFDVAAGRPGRAYVTTTEEWGFPRIIDTGNNREIGNITSPWRIYQKALVRISRDRSTLFIGERLPSPPPSVIYKYSVTSDYAQLVGKSPFGSIGDLLQDFAISPDNKYLYVAAAWPHNLQVLDHRNWTTIGTLDVGPYSNSVSLAREGRLAFASRSSAEVLIAETTNSSLVKSFPLSQDARMVRGLEDGTKVYAITRDVLGSNGRLEVVYTGLPPPTDVPLDVTIAATPASGNAPLEVSFFGEAVGGSPPYGYSWTFGDGGGSGDASPQHAYRAPGTYTVTLRALDVSGKQGVAAATVVAAGPPTVPESRVIFLQEIDGLRYGPSGVTSNSFSPPDVQVAVGPNHVVEMVNLIGRIWTKQGSLVKTFELAPFFRAIASEFATDPRILYDPVSGRWFATIVDFGEFGSGAVRVVVSKSADPTGDWWHYSLPTAGSCPDQPIFAVSDDKVVISADDVTCYGGPSVGGVWVGAQYWVLNKTDLLQGSNPSLVSFGPFLDLHSVHPVRLLSPTSTQFMVSVGWDRAPEVQLLTITGAPPGPVTVRDNLLPTKKTEQPPNAFQRGGNYTLDTGDARVQDAVWNQGKLWLTFNEACIPTTDQGVRSCLRFIQLDTTNLMIKQDFSYGSAGDYYFYPALWMDSRGNALAIFGYSSPTKFPGIAVAVRMAGDSPNTMRPPKVVKEGSGPVATGCSGDACRYGDYFGAAVDPARPNTVWLAGEFGASSGWATWIGEVEVPIEVTSGPPPSYADATFQSAVAGAFLAFAVSATVLVYRRRRSRALTRPPPPSAETQKEAQGTGLPPTTEPTSRLGAPDPHDESRPPQS